MWPFTRLAGKTDRKTDEQLEKLVSALSHDALHPSPMMKERLREHLLASLLVHRVQQAHGAQNEQPEGGFSFSRLIEGIRAVSTETVPPVILVAKLRERLLWLVRRSNILGFKSVFRQFFFSRKLVTTFALVVFVVTGMFGFILDADRAYASPLAHLSSFAGSVSLKRGDEFLALQTGMSLQVGDFIETGDHSFATVGFVDDSLIRLGANTKISIDSLLLDPKYQAYTDIGVWLEEGKLWSRTIALIGSESNFEIKTKKINASVNKKAAFSVEVKDAGTSVKVQAVQNAVNITFAENDEVQEKTLVSGFELAVDEKGALPPAVSSAASETSAAEDEAWIAENLESDKQYVAAVLEGKKEEGKKKAMKKLNPVGALESVTTELSGDLEKKLRARLAGLEDEFMVFFGADEIDEVALGKFDEKLTIVMNESLAAPADTETPPRELVRASLFKMRRQAAPLPPDDGLYPLKVFIIEKSALFLGGSARFTRVAERAFELQELLVKGTVDEVKEVMDELSQDLAELPAQEIIKDDPGKITDAVEGSLELITSVQVLKKQVEQASVSKKAVQSGDATLPADGEKTEVIQEAEAQTPESITTLTQQTDSKTQLQEAVGLAERQAFYSLGESLLQFKKESNNEIQEAGVIKMLNSIDIADQKITDVQFGENGVQIRGRFVLPATFEESLKEDPAAGQVLLRRFNQSAAGDTVITLQLGKDRDEALANALKQFVLPLPPAPASPVIPAAPDDALPVESVVPPLNPPFATDPAAPEETKFAF